jgi:hypothetical protein
LKVRARNNDGLSIPTKLFAQVLIALMFFYIYMRGGGDANLTITSLGININFNIIFLSIFKSR